MLATPASGAAEKDIGESGRSGGGDADGGVIDGGGSRSTSSPASGGGMREAKRGEARHTGTDRTRTAAAAAITLIIPGREARLSTAGAHASDLGGPFAVTRDV